MVDGFLGRWSRRKLGEKEAAPETGEAFEAPAPPPQMDLLPPPLGDGGGGGTPPQEIPPPPTLADVQLLTADSDFRRFITPDVAPEVKNAAMKKLFADPHYNVMDRLDTYIDDYSQPDPIPESMLRKLASAKFLGLFAQEEEEELRAATTRDDANDPAPESVAQSPLAPPAVTQAPPDADTDLRLQQDDAPAGQEPRRGTE